MNGPSVLFVDQSGELGGAELSLLDIVRHRSGPQAVCLLQEGPFAAYLAARAVPVLTLQSAKLPNTRRESGLVEIASAAPATWHLLREFAEHARQYDVIYANSMKAFVIAALARPLHRRPLIWHLHDLLTADHFSASLRRSAVLLASIAASCIVGNSCATVAAYRRCGDRGRVEAVHIGLDSAPFDLISAPEARANLLAETGLDAGRPIVGVFSRLARWKGQHVLVEAMRRLPDCQAVLVGGALFGEAAYETELRHAIAKAGMEHRVQLLGFRDDVPALMKAVDIVAHTSIAPEPFGRVIVEGMLAGKPVLATRAGGAVELVQDEETGLLVGPGDVNELVGALKRLNTDRSTSTAMARRAGRAARLRFSVDVYVTEIERIIGSVARPARDR